MNISHFGRLVGAGLLALGLSALAPQAAAKSFSQASQWNCFVQCDDGDDEAQGFESSAARAFMLGHGHGSSWEQMARSLVGRSAAARGTVKERDAQFDVEVVVELPPTVAAPVPEPQTWALMVAGLAALGFMSRRRARRG